MKRRFIIIGILAIVSTLPFWHFGKAQTNTVTMAISGDSYNVVNTYDSLIKIKPQSNLVGFNDYHLQTIGTDQSLDSPLAYYKFDENQGEVVNDYSGQGNNITKFIGGVSWSTGKFGSALQFNGTGHVNTPSNLVNAPEGKAARSISFWAYKDPNASNPPILAQVVGYGDNRTAGSLFMVSQYSNNTLFFWGNSNNYSTNLSFDSGVWNHFVVVFDGKFMKAYKNGQSAPAQAIGLKTGVSDSCGIVSIGFSPSVCSRGIYSHFNGLIDEVRIYSFALTDVQVKELYNQVNADGQYWRDVPEADIINEALGAPPDQTQNFLTFIIPTNTWSEGDVRFRVYADTVSGSTEPTYRTVSIRHRLSNLNSHYAVERFITNDYHQPGVLLPEAFWDTSRGLVELTSNNNEGYISSFNLIPSNSQPIEAVTIYPVIYRPPLGTIEFQFSNDGQNWYGDTSGHPNANIWYTFNRDLNDSVTILFRESLGTGLFWRAHLASPDPINYNPKITQLRFLYQVNAYPQACFTVTPSSSLEPKEIYYFDASCSSDLEDSLTELQFRWDWLNDGSWSAWETGAAGYLPNHIFNSTSTQIINLQVQDRQGALNQFYNLINAPYRAGGEIYGWAWSSNYGWVSLNCNNTYYGTELDACLASSYGFRANEDSTLQGWAWDSNLGWLCLGRTCQPYGTDPVNHNSPEAIFSRATGQVVGWAKYLSFGDEGWLALNYGAYNGQGCEDVNYPCVNINLTRRTLSGWAWAGGVDVLGNAEGPGWLQFLGAINVPWLETKFGSVYSYNNIGSPNSAQPPDQRYSATYCILARGSITNFSSEGACSQDAFADFNFPGTTNNYRTIAGVISPTILNNAQTLGDSDLTVSLPTVLGNEVYYYNAQGDKSISHPITLYNARGLDSSGAGTVVVNGDLYIHGNINYETNAVTSKIENLASVAFIVYGDVIVDAGVTNLSGDFIVLGRDNLNCSADQVVAGCGRFVTSNDPNNNRQLVVNGLIMAKQFSFDRLYKENGEPAEDIIYDGRVLINTPPGLENVAKGLPVWREAATSASAQ